MVGTGPARVAMNGHKATWEGAGPRTSVSPTMIPHHQLRLAVVGAPEISPATRFSFDKWRPGHAGPGRGWGAPHPQIPFNPPHPQIHHFRQRYLSIYHTHRCTAFVKDTFQSTTLHYTHRCSTFVKNTFSEEGTTPTDPQFSSKIPFNPLHFTIPADPPHSSKIPFPFQHHPIRARAAVHSILFTTMHQHLQYSCKQGNGTGLF